MNTLPDKYHNITKIAMTGAAACGPLGAFSSVADIATISGIWGTFLYAASQLDGIAMSKEAALQVCKTVLIGSGGYYSGCKFATRLFNLIPGAGTLVGMSISSLANILFTYRFALTVALVLSNYHATKGLSGIASEMKTMFRGNGMIHDVTDIVHLYSI